MLQFIFTLFRRRQQHRILRSRRRADDAFAARSRIVEGAVGMVEMALELLSAKHVVELDEERKASMVSTLS